MYLDSKRILNMLNVMIDISVYIWSINTKTAHSNRLVICIQGIQICDQLFSMMILAFGFGCLSKLQHTCKVPWISFPQHASKHVYIT